MSAVVVVGVDGSDQSRRALAWALTYAGERDHSVEAVSSVDTFGLNPQDADQAVAEARQRLATTVAEVVAGRPDAPPVAQAVVPGDPAVALVDASRTAELLVLGSHGMTRIRNAVLGSVTLACIRMGSCPVLVIPAAPPEAPGGTVAVPAGA